MPHLVEIVQIFRRRFLNLVNVFSLFRNYLPLKKSVAFHLNKFESHSPKITTIGWNWSRGSEEEDEKFTNFVKCFFAISLLSPLVKGVGLHLNKLDPLYPMNALYRIRLTMAQWFLIIRYLNFGNIRNKAETLYLGALGMKLIRYYVPYINLQI